MLLQHLGNDLRHRQVLEDALVCAQAQVAQLLHDAQFVASQALAECDLGDLVDQAVNAQTVGGQGEKGALMQPALQIQLETIALADGFALGVR